MINRSLITVAFSAVISLTKIHFVGFLYADDGVSNLAGDCFVN